MEKEACRSIPPRFVPFTLKRFFCSFGFRNKISYHVSSIFVLLTAVVKNKSILSLDHDTFASGNLDFNAVVCNSNVVLVLVVVLEKLNGYKFVEPFL